MSSGSDTDSPSKSSSTPAQGLELLTASRPSRVSTLCATMVSLTSIGLITRGWWTGRFDHAPWWAPLAGILISAIPGGLLGTQLGTVGRLAVKALVDRLPKAK